MTRSDFSIANTFKPDNGATISRLIAYLDESVAVGRIAGIEILEDESEDPLDPGLHRFVVQLIRLNKAPIACTGINRDRTTAMLVAAAEAVERELYLRDDLTWTNLDIRRGNRSKGKLHLKSTNGLALHTDAQACFHNALAEAVERHAVVLNWYRRLPARCVLTKSYSSLIAERISAFERRSESLFPLLPAKIGPFYVGAYVAFSEKGDHGYHLLFSSAADLDLDRAMDRAWGELVAMYRSRPLEKVLKSGGPPREIKTLNDHLAYYQRPNALDDFTFLFDAPDHSVSCLKLAEPDKVSRDDFARKVGIVVSTADLPESLTGLALVHCRGEGLLNIRFGADHTGVVPMIEQTYGPVLQPILPHPLA